MSQSYRVALIGCGWRGKAHVPALLADKRCQVVALVDPVSSAAAEVNAQAGFGAEIYADHQEMLAAAKPDVVVLCLWTDLHLPVFTDCAAAGVKAVLSEKPMARTWGESKEMARIATETGCMLTLCHQRRFAPGNILARQLLAKGTFGDLELIDLYSPPHLMDCGTHTFDQALSFNQESPAKWAMASVDATSLVKYFGISAEATAAGTIVFENGVRATFQVGGPDLPIWGGARVTGTKGFFEISWDGEFTKARVYDDPSFKLPTAQSSKGIDMEGVVRNALDCLESGAEPELSYHKALRAAEIIFASYESVRRNARIELPLVGVEDNPFLTMLESGAFSAS